MNRRFISGTTACAEAARLARVQVVAAYPITPQTHIVEALTQYAYDGVLEAEMIPVESEYAAMSASVGASLVGARAFTASSSQGLALMHEILPYAAGLRLPLVMAVANRSVASPVTIFADHQDSLPQRETGFLQLYAESCQEILDLTLLAYRVAEDTEVLLPVMVCFDGFFLSHISEPVEVPGPEEALAFVPLREPAYPTLDLDRPKCFNVMAFPEYFEEFQRDKHESMLRAAGVFDRAAEEFAKTFGRKHERLKVYRVEDAEQVLVGLGSMMGTTRQVVDRLREQGRKVGMIGLLCYRPFPMAELSRHLAGGKTVGVLDRDLGYGSGGIVFQDVCRSLYNLADRGPAVNFILGLGGRDVTEDTIEACYDRLARLDRHQALPAGQEVFWPDENRDLLAAWKMENGT